MDELQDTVLIIVASVKDKLGRIEHKLLKCPTFWQLKPAFHCPTCKKGYRCYWDGNDIKNVGINICNKCAKVLNERLEEEERRLGDEHS